MIIMIKVMMTRMMVMIVMIAILIATIIDIIILIVIFVSHFAKTFFYMMTVFSSFRKSKTFVLLSSLFLYVSRTLNDYFSMYFYDEEITVIFLYLMVTYFLGSKRCFEVEYIYTRLYATL